jgi:hypothetical protein
MPRQIEDVGTKERFPSGQNDHRLPDEGDLIHHLENFLRWKLSRVRTPFG